MGPLEKSYGKYRITLRKIDHANGRPTPHVEIWKGNKKLGNYDMASGKALFRANSDTPEVIKKAISNYLNDQQVSKKIIEMIEASFFDLSKPAGTYGGIPRGFKVTISVEFTSQSLNAVY
ncbi:MAG: hypothetical protein VR67_11790 [Peptococcaceae bacterium BRH_c8a]|nr:MAG: hypothetical protein VR67_11790 [Peptococcaceae bacterium BRH_c8a]